jgi:two-component system cell cycle response regulator DivK
MSGAPRILVVEDNPMNLELVRDILTAEGYEVLEAADGATGVAIATLERPALILMDLQLPRLDGLEAARLIRADPRLADIPIVAVTAHAMKGDDEKARAAGCDGFVTKPIQVREFVATVAAFLKGAKSGSAPA